MDIFLAILALKVSCSHLRSPVFVGACCWGEGWKGQYPLLFSFSAHSNILQQNFTIRLNSGEPLLCSSLTKAVTIRPLIRTAFELVIRLLSTVEIRLLSRTALSNGIPKAIIQQQSIPQELVQHSNISENSGVAPSRAANRASAAWETTMEILEPLQAN